MYDRKLTMDEPAPAGPAAASDRDMQLQQVANANRQAQQARQGFSDMALRGGAPDGQPPVATTAQPSLGPNINTGARPGGSPPISQLPQLSTYLKPQGPPPATSGSLIPEQPRVGGADALAKLRGSQPAAPAQQQPAMLPRAAARPSYAMLGLNPRTYANAAAVQAPRTPAPARPIVAPRTAPLVPPQVLQQATPFDSGGYLRQSPDIGDSFAKFQTGDLTEGERQWFDNIGRTNPEALTSPEAFAKWHYDNIGKNEPGRNPGGRVPGTL